MSNGGSSFGTVATNRAIDNSKCVKPCRAKPGTRCHRRPGTGACATASPSVQAVSRQGVPGISSMPPSSPEGGRRRSNTEPVLSVSKKCAPCRMGRARLADLTGSVAAMPCACPVQPGRQGHSAQPGLRGEHNVAPKSNSAWAKSPGRARIAGSLQKPWAAAASFDFTPGSGRVSAVSRARTRSTLPSTGTTGTAKAMAAMAAPVYMQIAGARVVAKPRPFLHHRRLWRRRKCRDIGEASKEAGKARTDGGDGCLLQHHFGQPDMVRLGPSLGGAKGQSAGVPIVPGQQRGGGG